MPKIAATAVALVLASFTAASFAQQAPTIPGLLEKGGAKLTKDELSALFAGATVTGEASTNPELKAETAFARDGKLAGRISPYVGRGPLIVYTGTWTISEKGEACYKLASQTNNFNVERCDPYYRLGNTYYQATPEGRLIERSFSR